MTKSDKTTRQKPGACCASDLLPDDPEGVVDRVRERYGKIASGRLSSCCGTSEADTAREIGYSDDDLTNVPEGANLGLGCGAPVHHLNLRAGEAVLDLGSGAGFDAFLAAPKVGPTGKVIGVDMTTEMIDKARANAERAGLSQVEFRQGRLEALPVDDASVDAVTSNCVINLVPDKEQVFREVARVLKPGGRLVISDVILDARLPEAVERDVLAHAGCVSGAMLRDNYFGILRSVGLTDIEVLRDTDFLAAVEQTQPDDVREFEQRTGVKYSSLQGKVRSVTYRASKPAR